MANDDLTASELEEVKRTVHDLAEWFGKVEKEVNKLKDPATSAQLERAVGVAGPPPDRGFDGKPSVILYPAARCRVAMWAGPK